MGRQLPAIVIGIHFYGSPTIRPSWFPSHRSMRHNSTNRSTLAEWKGSPEEVEGQIDVGDEEPHAEK